ncbi:MAG: adenylosuccinate lyase family protein [Ardenticatenales bacterium]|nr:adenylosuccinate lyase family protein [Ardenticatenales bacterium]
MSIPSELFGSHFATSEMAAIFADQQTVAYYLEVERALARVQAELGLIPAEAAAAIEAGARLERLDWAALLAGIPAAGVPTIPLVQQIIAAVGPAGEWVHFGATSQDIMDTALVLQLREALTIVERDLAELKVILTGLARSHRDTVMVGRSQLQQALPITFGLKAAGWLSMILRHQERLAQLKPRLLVGQFSGAVGTLASLGGSGLAVQASLCAALGLGQPLIGWHTARDNLAELAGFLGLVSGTLAKIGYDIALLAQNEVGEATEAYAPGRGGSSTMPQKRNQLSPQKMMVTGRLTRHQVALMLEAMVNDHERGTGIWPVEWAALPEAFRLTAVGLAEGRKLLASLQLNPERMAANLALSQGTLLAEAIMMALAPHVGRATAHHLLQEAVAHTVAQNRDLASILVEMDSVTRWLNPAEIRRLTDPAHYLGTAGQMIDNVVRAAEQR